MSAPSYTPRVTPPYAKMEDGYKALVTFAADPDVALWEIDAQTPGIDGGDPIPQSTMHNGTFHTDAPRSLIRLTPITFTAQYSWVSLSQVLSLVNVRTTISVSFSTGNYVAFYGYLQSFMPDNLAEGERPQGTATVMPTNTDPSSGAEEGPVFGTT